MLNEVRVVETRASSDEVVETRGRSDKVVDDIAEPMVTLAARDPAILEV